MNGNSFHPYFCALLVTICFSTCLSCKDKVIGSVLSLASAPETTMPCNFCTSLTSQSTVSGKYSSVLVGNSQISQIIRVLVGAIFIPQPCQSVIAFCYHPISSSATIHRQYNLSASSSKSGSSRNANTTTSLGIFS